MTPDAPRPPVAGALLGWLAGVAAWTTWSGMVAEPRDFLVPTALGGLVVVAAGIGLARLRVPPHVVVLVQLVVALLALNVSVARAESLGGLVPTPSSLERTAGLVVLGGRAMGYYLAPVEAFPDATSATLVAGGLALLWVVAALAQGLGRPALVALPLLVAVSVPISVLDEAVSVAAFCLAGVAYLMLLVTDRHHRWRDADWAGRDATGRAAARPLPRVTTAWQVAAVSVGAALLIAPLVPVIDAARPGSGGGSGTGRGGTVRLTTVNPFISLQRDLLEQTDTPMVYARTDAADPGYLRTTVLDVFTEDGWSASQRELPSENEADGTFPAPPGVSAGARGETARWDLRLEPGFSTRWLPLPYPVREVSVPGSWRYDDRFLDVGLISGTAAPGMRYQAISLQPVVTADALDRALSPPRSVTETFLETPELPSEVVDTARRVVAGAQTPYAQAVALQDWFREDGDFRYSLEARAGSGLQLLADFVTVDRVGYCEQYAAAMAAMGRSLGIPSRVAVGFLRPERLPDGQLLYTSDTRHAWVEMYFSGAGWVRFEPTPAQVSGASPGYTREATAAESPSATPRSEAAERRQGDRLDPDDPAADADEGSAGTVALAVLALVALALLAPRALRHAQRRRRLTSGPAALPEAVWDELRAEALDAGVAWDDRRSARQQAEVLRTEVLTPEHPDLVAATVSLEALLHEVERGRYAPTGGGGVAEKTRTLTRADLLATSDRWRTLLAEHAERRPVTGAERARRMVLPRSLSRR